MNFGEKFPYALLTFSQSLSKLIVGHTLSQKFVEAGYWPHLFHARTHTFSQKLSKLVIGVHYTPVITRTPSSTSTPTPHTNHTPTHHTQSHNPAHTPPPAS